MERSVNPDKVFFNFQGKLPPLTLEETPVTPPPNQTYPKLLTDTTLRDGAQDPGFALFPHEAKLRYFDLLHRLDAGTGRIEAVEAFIYQKRDLWVLEKLLERGYEFPRVTTWTRATPKDIKLMVEVTQGRVKETGMLASASDHHIFDKQGFHGKDEAIEKYLSPILTACEQGIVPRVHLEDCTKADIYGWVIPFVQRVFRETEGTARFRVCDTLGIGSPDPYAALPFGVPRLIATIAQETGVELEFHGHNDFGLVTANSLAAFRYGARRVNVAFGGLGERTGNAPLEEVLANYIRLYGDPGFDLAVLSEMAELINREVTPISPKRPLLGQVFTTQAGIHQTGLERQKQAEGGLIYLPFEPALVGRQPTELNLIGALSGMDGIVAVLNRQAEKETGAPGHYTVASRLIKHIYDRVQEAYDGHYDPATDSWSGYRTTFFKPEDILALARQLAD